MLFYVSLCFKLHIHTIKLSTMLTKLSLKYVVPFGKFNMKIYGTRVCYSFSDILHIPNLS